MSQQGTAKAGGGGSASNGNGSGTAREDLAAGTARENVAGTDPLAGDSQSPVFGDGQSEAEAQLYAHHDRVSNYKPASGFPPLDELHARWNEASYRESPLYPRPEEELVFSLPGVDEVLGLEAELDGEPRHDLLWIDHRFTELKQLLLRKDEGQRELEQIKASLGVILVRLEKLAAEMPNGKTLESVENKIDTLSGSVEAAREQAATDASRISRAAEELLAASARFQEVPARFEAAARRTVEGLGQTVAATASRAAMMTAHQVGAQQPAAGGDTAGRLEAELRALNLQSRESGKRTEAALDRVHSTLKDFLGRDAGGTHADDSTQPPRNSTQPPRKRTGLHVPISGNSAVYKRGDTGFGAAPASEARLDTLLRRDPPPSDPALYEALREADRKYGRKKQHERPETAGARPAFGGAYALPGDEKTAPLGGIAAVAFILLLVSAALFYLHMKGRIGVRISEVPAAIQQLVHAPARPAPAAVASASSARQKSPALLAAADDSRGAQAPSSAGALEALETAARNGERDAQFRIGVRFLNDDGMNGGRAAAARWFAKAAAQGHSEAQFMLASMLERGAGVEKDEAKAIALYRQAANAGHVRAMHNLGAMLLKNATALTYREAASWFGRAAEEGFPDSQYNLALLYEHGLGIEQDLSRAYQWYVEAAKGGVKEAAVKARQLRRMLPSAQNAPSGGKAGQSSSWQPVIVVTKKSTSPGGAGRG